MNQSTTDPKKRIIKIKSMREGFFLCLYNVETHSLEFHKKSQTFTVPLHDLIEFGRTSQRDTFRVVAEDIKPDVLDGEDEVKREFE